MQIPHTHTRARARAHARTHARTHTYILLLLLQLHGLIALVILLFDSILPVETHCLLAVLSVLSVQVNTEPAAARVEAEVADSTMTDAESMRLEEKLRQFQNDMATEQCRLL